MDRDVIGQREGFTLRLARAEDGEAYYEQNYCPLDREVARLTGCKTAFSREEVLDNGRYADDILMAMLEDEWREMAGGSGA